MNLAMPHSRRPAPRKVRLTPELVALCERQELDYGRNAGLTPLTDDDRARLVDRLLAECGDKPLWVFIYGSLMWKPAFAHVEERLATAHGWHRQFSLVITNFRATPHQPGLMMALERGGTCRGVACRAPDDARREAIEGLLKREVNSHEAVRAIRWINVLIDGERVRALVFWAGARDVPVKLRQPPEQVAHTLARACGYVGSGAAYLYNTVEGLKQRGIRDRGLWRLQSLVAREIADLHGV